MVRSWARPAVQLTGHVKRELSELEKDGSHHWPEGVAIPRGAGFNGVCVKADGLY